MIGISLFGYTGCSPTLKEQQLESQNKDLRGEIESSNDRLKEMEFEIADLKEQDAKTAIRAQNIRDLNQTVRDRNQAEIAENENELAQNKTEMARNQAEIAWNQSEMDRDEAEIARINRVNDELKYELSEEIKKGEVSITQNQSNLVIYVAERLFFDSGNAELTDTGKKSLNKIGTVLNEIPERTVRIEGHTDNVPIGKDLQSKFPTNWELSAVRAVNVVKYLSMEANVDANRISAAAFGQFSPLASNSSEEGRALNRRIEILITEEENDRYSMSQ